MGFVGLDVLDATGGMIRPPLSELFTETQWAWLQTHFGLPNRQAQIARLICRGCTNDAIAAHLRLSGATVRMHTDGLYKRVRVQSRLGLLVRFLEAVRGLEGNGGNGRT